MASGRILIIDDNPSNLKLMSFVLEAAGYPVDTATDATGATAAIEAARPALILMDVQLPGIDGLELTRRLKSHPDTRGIVIIAVTAYAMVGDEERARGAGCDGYVTKPIDTRTFAQTVVRFLPSA